MLFREIFVIENDSGSRRLSDLGMVVVFGSSHQHLLHREKSCREVRRKKFAGIAWGILKRRGPLPICIPSKKCIETIGSLSVRRVSFCVDLALDEF